MAENLFIGLASSFLALIDPNLFGLVFQQSKATIFDLPYDKDKALLDRH